MTPAVFIPADHYSLSNVYEKTYTNLTYRYFKVPVNETRLLLYHRGLMTPAGVIPSDHRSLSIVSEKTYTNLTYRYFKVPVSEIRPLLYHRV
jgi:hypothetical protein